MRRYRIGRAETNDIVLRDPSVSREHAELIRLGQGLYKLRDLGSSYGTAVPHGSDWGLITAADIRGDTPVRIGEVESTADDLVHAAVVRAVRSEPAAKPVWFAAEPRLSPRAKARHPETVFIATGYLPPGSRPPRGETWLRGRLAPLLERWQALSEDARLALSLLAGFGVFLTIAAVTLTAVLI